MGLTSTLKVLPWNFFFLNRTALLPCIWFCRNIHVCFYSMGYMSFNPACSVISPSFPDWVGGPDHSCLPGLVPWRLTAQRKARYLGRTVFSICLHMNQVSKSNTFPLPLLHSHFCTWVQLHNQTFCHLPLDIQSNIYRRFCLLNSSFSPDFLLQLLSAFVTRSTFHQADYRKSREPESF